MSRNVVECYSSVNTLLNNIFIDNKLAILAETQLTKTCSRVTVLGVMTEKERKRKNKKAQREAWNASLITATSLTCQRCRVSKPVTEFIKHHFSCFECRRRYTTAYRQRNLEKLRERDRLWKVNFRKTHPDEACALDKSRRRSPNYKAHRVGVARVRRSTDLNFKRAYRCRARLWQKLKHGKLLPKHTDLFGCTLEVLKRHLEEMFTAGMTWDTYGLGGWEVDHIKPVREFDLTKREEMLRCFHYTNLRPLWKGDNLARNRKY